MIRPKMVRPKMVRPMRRGLKAGALPLALLGAASLACIAAALWPVDAGAPGAAAPAPAPAPGRSAAAETGAALSRPLFDPERRDWTARGSREDLTAEAQAPTLLSVRGILIEDRVRRALVEDGAGASAWLVPGEGRGAWRLVSIEPTQVVVADSARHYTLAFLGPPVALRPAPRHPAPEPANLRPALRPGEDAAPVAETVPASAAPKGAPVRRIEITRPGSP